MKQALKATGLLITIATVGIGFYIAGSPEYNRELREDQQRIRDAYTIHNAIKRFYKKSESVPDSIATLKAFADEHDTLNYPLTDYHYTATGKNDYQLCTTFHHKSDARNSEYREYWERGYYRLGSNDWEHPAGEYCFSFTARE